MSRKNKSLGTVNQVTQILDSLFFGKYHFEVAMVLRSSMLLSSLLLNSEAWVNISDKDIRSLEQADENFLNKVLGCDPKTSNVFKYLELGIYPIRFEIMKRKVLFLKYILQQDKKSMMFKVFEATCENPVKKDFVKTCRKYLELLNINLSFDNITEMTKHKFKQMVKNSVSEAAFKYLLEEKGKQSKIANLEYSKLEIQEYLVVGNKNTEISKLLFKARGKSLDIKTHKKWKYDDDICVGCGVQKETETEILACEKLQFSVWK